MLRYLFIPLLSLLPCVLWLWYFYTRSIYKRDPLRLIAWTFVLGGLMTLPALVLNLAGQSLILRLLGSTDSAQYLTILLVISPVEEVCKLLAVFAWAWRHQEFDEPLDGVIYSAAAALGFAAAENIVYLSQNDPALVLLRGPLSNPGHALFSAVWGLSLSRVRAAPNLLSRRVLILVKGFALAVLLHALYDVLVIQAERIGPILYPVIVAALLVLFFQVRARIHHHRDTSPHREGTVLLQLSAECPQCGWRGLVNEACQKCGTIIPLPEAEEHNGQPTGQQPVINRPRHRFLTRTAEGTENIAWLLKQPEIFVGRTLNNEFVIEHPSVSRRHARITAGNGSYVIQDLGSSNGTFINGRRITEARLKDGCEVKFGSVSFIYRAARE